MEHMSTKKSTTPVDAYWKLLELKAKLRAEAWEALIDKLYELW